MSELKIGDEGETTVKGERYRIVAESSDPQWPLIAECVTADGNRGVDYCKRTGWSQNWNTRLLPPTPKTETMRRWLLMSHGGLLLQFDEGHPDAARPADITYQPDGRIESIVFVDEPPTDGIDDLKTFHDWLESPERFAEWKAAADRDAAERGIFVTGNGTDNQPTTLDIRQGDVVRLRNGTLKPIAFTDARCIALGVDTAIVGGTNDDDCIRWYATGQYIVDGQPHELDIVAVYRLWNEINTGDKTDAQGNTQGDH